MDGFEWVVIDTETNGIGSPIHVIEIAAWHMRGWERAGEGFRRLINHGVSIDPRATMVHGYTKEYVSKWGDDPIKVYNDLRQYIEGRPIVAYNLPFDERVLTEEWARLGIPAIGTRGFCALRLTRRLLDQNPAGDYKLQTLKAHFGLPDRKAHSALGDVETTIDLIESILAPIARSRGLSNWEDLSSLAHEKSSSTRPTPRKRTQADPNRNVIRPISDQISEAEISIGTGRIHSNNKLNISSSKIGDYINPSEHVSKIDNFSPKEKNYISMYLIIISLVAIFILFVIMG
jgi:DNA polymerase III epsilon subunit-like protein